jgi:hypothetical protein
VAGIPILFVTLQSMPDFELGRVAAADMHPIPIRPIDQNDWHGSCNSVREARLSEDEQRCRQ